MKRLFEWLAKNISYSFAIAFTAMIGGQMAAVFGILFLFTTVDLYRDGWIVPALITLVCGLLLASLLHYFMFGLGRLWGWKRLELPRLRLLNDQIHKGRISASTSTSDLEHISHSLDRFPLFNAHVSLIFTALVLFLGLLTDVLALGHWGNLFGFAQATLVALSLYGMFSITVTELVTTPLRREVRRRLVQRGVWIQPGRLASLRVKLGFLVGLIFLAIFVSTSLLLRGNLEYPLLAIGFFAALSLAIGGGLSALIFLSIQANGLCGASMKTWESS